MRTHANNNLFDQLGFGRNNSGQAKRAQQKEYFKAKEVDENIIEAEVISVKVSKKPEFREVNNNDHFKKSKEKLSKKRKENQNYKNKGLPKDTFTLNTNQEEKSSQGKRRKSSLTSRNPKLEMLHAKPEDLNKVKKTLRERVTNISNQARADRADLNANESMRFTSYRQEVKPWMLRGGQNSLAIA